MPYSEDSISVKTQRIRSITDGISLVLFTLLWCFMIIISAFSFTFGDPTRLSHGYDSFGNICGSNSNRKIGRLELSGKNMTDNPYVFYMDSHDLKNSMRICVRECVAEGVNNINELRNLFQTTGLNLCKYDFNVLTSTVNDIQNGLNESLTISSPFGPCPVFPIQQTYPILNRCIPSDYTGTVHDLLDYWDVIQLLLLDIFSLWPVIITFFFAALIGASAIMSLFYLATTLASHLVLAAVTLVSVSGTTLLWWKYCQIKEEKFFNFECCQSSTALLISAILATILCIVILLLVAYLRCRISFLEILCKESADCLRALSSIYLLPIVTSLTLAAFYIFWIFVMSYLASSRYPETHELTGFYVEKANFNLNYYKPGTNMSISNFKKFTQVDFSEGPWTQHLWWVCLIGLVWVSEFVLACQQMIVAGAVARWYFNGKIVPEKNLVLTSLKCLVVYHLGSAALGSLLITFFKIPRLMIGTLYLRYRRGVKENCCTSFCYKSCLYCFSCYENFNAHITHNAYTVVEMQGVNFLTAGKRAWIINLSNKLKMARENAYANVIMFLNKCLVTSSVGSIAFLYFSATDSVYSPILPTLLVIIYSFFISHCVVSLFELTVDTLYLCLSEDQDINQEDGLWKQSPLVPQDCHCDEPKNKPSTSI